MWNNYHIIESETQLVELLANQAGLTKIISGGTDVMVEIRNGKWSQIEDLLDISRIPGLDQVWMDNENVIHIGTLVTHGDVLRSKLLREHAFPLVQACHTVATPQLRNRATVVGNLATASPANDTITPLMALGASLVLKSARGERTVSLADFYLGVRRTVMERDEFIRELCLPVMKPSERGNFKKQALRRAQAIAVLNCCVVLDLEEGVIRNPRVTMGSVAATIIHSPLAEEYLDGKALTPAVAVEAARLAASDTRPISDVRAGEDYRAYMMKALVENALLEIKEDKLNQSVPAKPITLNTLQGWSPVSAGKWDGDVIRTTINGEEYAISGFTDGTLLNLVREKVGLTGSKPGCEEGECGACTLYLDGRAVVSCLVPAGRAHMANITTIEGLADGDTLHPVQQAFVDHGAVQCGYCTPGFVMAAAKMIEENPKADRATIKEAISGNLCRCTGYYKIVEAIEDVCLKMGR